MESRRDIASLDSTASYENGQKQQEMRSEEIIIMFHPSKGKGSPTRQRWLWFYIVLELILPYS